MKAKTTYVSMYCPQCQRSRKHVLLEVKEEGNLLTKTWRCLKCSTIKYTRRRIQRMILVTIHLPAEWLKRLNKLVEMGRYPNRSEAIRVAVRDLLMKEEEMIRGSSEYQFISA